MELRFVCFFVLLAIAAASSPYGIDYRCKLQCPLQNRTEDIHFDVGCGTDCKIAQCLKGCELWERALLASCQAVCNGTQELLPPKELYCVMGCNNAVNTYLHQLQEEMGTPAAPALVADSLTATSLSLVWDGKRLANISYLVQWKYEEMADSWHYARNQTWASPSVVFIDDLQPYTKYRFRVAMVVSVAMLSEPIVSEPSLVINTLPGGVPGSPPRLLRATAIDHSKVSVSWLPGLFPHGPILSYVLSINELPHGYKGHKDIPASENKHIYMFHNLLPSRNYSVSVAMRNAEGLGPAATTTVSTPRLTEVKDENEKVNLILAGDHSIISQPADMFAEPTTIYKTMHLIRGMDVDVRRGQVYISQSNGEIFVLGMNQSKYLKRLVSSLDFEPHALSFDWLNDLLYILGNAHGGKMWQVARCSATDGSAMTVAIAGLYTKPLHVEVDPYNGYLFWIMQGGPRGGLYRLDLADISNGIKHEVIPDLIFANPDLGAFTVDHSNFRVLVPDHALNTVVAVSLDGEEVIDIRKNMQRPQFKNVISLAIGNGLFYWTTGSQVLTEEYNPITDNYYHNVGYLDAVVSAFVAVAVFSESAQPIPLPVNPPTTLQAIMGHDVARASWTLPHLLGGQGRGAWQSWNYELNIHNLNDDTVIEKRGINLTSFTVVDLSPDTVYVLKAAAYTQAGKGPWSTPFQGKTLKKIESGENSPKILWSTADGLVISDALGETAQTLIHKEKMKDSQGSHHITGITWFEDQLYLVTNTSALYWYNLTSHAAGRLSEVDAVGSIAVDWLGRKIYWSNPKQQLIIRGNLNGSQQEPLPILTIAKELNIDAIHGFIYWSTGHAVESSRLNGKQRLTYYPAELFSGKQVMGLTLDMESHSVYWIVRNYEGSTLFKAVTANRLRSGEEIIPVKMSILQYPDMQGSLCYFDDHLLWLRDDKNAVIGDLSGQNSAVLTGLSLTGINVVTVLDNSLHTFPDELQNNSINVIPEQVAAQSLRVVGTHESFNITWNPVKTVNYGQVFYELKITRPSGRETMVETTNNYWKYTERDIAPYSTLKVTLRGLTYWAASPHVSVILHSPPSIPSLPLKPRVFVNFFSNPIRTASSIMVTFRWDPPELTNGPITEYRVLCRLNSSDNNSFCNSRVSMPSPLEIINKDLPRNSSFFFQVQGCTAAGCGEVTRPILGHTGIETAVPRLLVAAGSTVAVADCDRHDTIVIARTVNSPAIHATYSAADRRLYWLDDNNDILMTRLGSPSKTKILNLNGTGLNIAIDWVGRFLYWSEKSEKEGTSTLKRLDLNLLDQGQINISTLLQRPAYILSLQVDPINGDIYWVEQKRNKFTYILKSKLDGTKVTPYFGMRSHQKRRWGRHACNCPESPHVGTTISIDLRSNLLKVIWVDIGTNNIMASDTKACTCHILVNSKEISQKGLPPTSISIDRNRLYWSNESLGHIYSMVYDSRVRNYEIDTMEMPGVKSIVTFGNQLQPFPSLKCLIPQQPPGVVVMVDRTSSSITLETPYPLRDEDCENISLATVRSVVHYGEIASDGTSTCAVNLTTCNFIESFFSFVTVKDLSPYTSYVFFLVQTNHYTELAGLAPKVGLPVIYQTSAGAPSSPEDVHVVVISPSCLQVSWRRPRIINSERVWYEVMWHSVGLYEGARHNGEQILQQDTKDNSTVISVRLTKLIPGLSYKVWVRAYSESNDVFSESSIIDTHMYPEPNKITLLHATSQTLNVSWQTSSEVDGKSYEMQFMDIVVGDWVKIPLKKHVNGTSFFYLTNLLPKTSYTFRVLINYTQDEQYIWPQDSRFTFKTSGDRPSAPGTPLVQSLNGTVYQVTWDPSRDNGALIEMYWLEGKRGSRESDPWGPSVIRQTRNSRAFYASNTSDVLPIIPDEWTLYYNGTDNYWIITKLNIHDKYKFRVRSKNSYGWSDYSGESNPFDLSTASQLVENHQIFNLMLWICIPATILTLFCFCIFGQCSFVISRNDKEKKAVRMTTVTIGNTDVELATLRELPRRRNLVTSTNALYVSGDFVPTPADIALLPSIKREHITLTKFLGSGAFGEVFEGTAVNLPATDGSQTQVAIKTLKKGATEQEKMEFLKEAQLMSNFKHAHILQLLGVCLDNDPSFIIMELMEAGDLLSYLRSNRPNVNGRSGQLSLADLLSISVDVARGCCYLEEMHFVHRDLACRNCLVSSIDPSNRIVKIGDFGLARDIYKNDYYRKEGEGLLPVRWMAPESLVDGVFTTQSDVWSFGVLLWEIMTLGQQPYPARNNVEVLHYVRSGGRLCQPPKAPLSMYNLMLKCWNVSPEERPTFKFCLEVLEELQTTSAEQLPHSYTNCTFKPETEGEAASTPKYLELIYAPEDGYEVPRSLEISSRPEDSKSVLPDDGPSSLDKLLPFIEDPTTASLYTNMVKNNNNNITKDLTPPEESEVNS